MSLQNFIDGVLWGLTQAFPGSNTKKLTQADFQSADTTNLKNEGTSFYSTFSARIALAPGIPGLNLGGVPVPIDQQAGYDYCRLRIGKIASFPPASWDWSGDMTLAEDMTAVAAAQPHVTVSVTVQGNHSVIVLTEG